MADHKRQHFVPRFYLKGFTANSKLINLYNWKRERAIFNASLREQCYVDYFYGADGKMESEFAEVEGIVSNYFKFIHQTGWLPDQLNEHHDVLLFWLVLQSCRTPYAADMLDEMTDKMLKATLEHHKDVSSEMLDAVNIHHTDPIKAIIGYKAPSYRLLRDLHMTLIVCPADMEFIASDTPVAEYNQMMRWRARYGSTTGLVWKGLQYFYPMSSRVLLMLYDPNVYVVGDRGKPWHFISDRRDVDEINVFTAANSYENIYFRSGASNFLKVVERARRLRRKDKTKMHKSPIVEKTDGKGFSQIISSSLEDVQMDMQLSFVKLNKPAKEWIVEAKKKRMMPAMVPRSAAILADLQQIRKERDKARELYKESSEPSTPPARSRIGQGQS